MPNAPINQSILSTPEEPVFNLPTIAAGDSLRIFIGLSAGCNVAHTWQALQPINNTYILNYSGGTFSYTPPLEYNTSIYVPMLNIIDMQPDYPIMNINDTYTREITVSQDGLYAYLDNFTYISDHHGGVEILNMIVTNPENGLSANLSFTDNGSNAIAQITPNIMMLLGLQPPVNGADLGYMIETQQLVISEEVKVVDCQPDYQLTDFKFSWGCGGELCDTAIYTNGYNIGQGLPELNIAISNQSPATLCENNFVEYTVSNIGGEILANSGYARDLVITFKTDCDDIAFADIYTPVAFSINGTPVSGNGALSADGSTYMFTLNSLNFLQDINGDGINGELPINSSFTFRFEYERHCFSKDCQSENVGLNCPANLLFAIAYADQCEIPRLPKQHTLLNIVDQPLSASYIEGTPTIVGSPQTATYRFCYNYMFGGIGCPDGSVNLYVTSSLADLVPTSATIDIGDNISPVSITNMGDGTYRISGGTIGSATQIIQDCWDITFQFNDSRPCGPLLKEELNFNVQYECSCADCLSDRVCEDYEIFIYNNCPGTCEGMTTNDFSIQRTTFSWSDESQSSLVTAATPEVALDRAYTCDQVRLTLDGGISNMPAGLTEFTGGGGVIGFYTPENIVPYEFNNATLVVNGLALTCAIQPPSVATVQDALGNDVVQWSFNFDACLDANNIALKDGDDIQLIVDATVIEAVGYTPNLTITQTTGLLYATNEAITSACMEVIKDFYVSTPRVQPFVYMNTTDIGGCSGNIEVVGAIEVPSASGDDFPNEYRPWFGDIEATVFNIADGYSYIAGSGSLEIVTLNNNGDPISTTIAIEPISQNGGTELVFSNTGTSAWPIPDKEMGGYVYKFKFNMLPSCKSGVSGNVSFKYNLFNHYYALPFDGSCMQPEEKENIVSFNYTAPYFAIDVLTPVVEGINKEASWRLRICNLAEQDADFSWVAFETPSGLIDFTSCSEITNNANTNLPLYEYGFNNDNIWVNMGHFAANTCREIELSATYSTCVLDTIDVKSGWDCNAANFINPDADGGCFGIQIPAQLQLQPEPTSIQASLVTYSDTIAVCDEAYFEVEFKNVSLGTVYDVNFDVVIPLQGAEIIPNSIEFAYTTEAPWIPLNLTNLQPIESTILGNVYRFKATDYNDILASDGLIGVPTPGDTLNRFKIRLRVNTNCEFRSGDIFRFRAFGVNSCGAFTDGTLNGAQLFIEGADAPYNTQLALQSTPIRPCSSEPVVFTATVQNFGPQPTGSYDFARVRLPQDIEYIPGTSSAIIPNSWAIQEPLADNSTGFQELNWQLPPNMPVNTTAQFTFEVDVKSADLNCGAETYVVETYTYGVATCEINGDIQECFLQTLTGNSNFSLITEKPNIVFLENNIDVYATCTNGNYEEINSIISLQNTGIATLEGSVIILKYIHDKNGNGTYEAGIDGLVGNYTYPNVIQQGEIVNINYSFLAAAGQACPILLMIDEGQNCICATNSLDIPNVRYYNAGENTSICSGTPLELGCSTVAGYTYQWQFPASNTGQLSCTDCANPTLTIVNNGTQPISETYTLITQRGSSGGCISQESVTITVNPQSTIMDNPVFLCEGETLQLNAPTIGSEYS
ncbi:MAG: hypothetical protein IPL35_06215 [Sphingobacteriales bacterium]|nr:hypothetical protein [Sphingobacteriales bacterium]